MAITPLLVKSWVNLTVKNGTSTAFDSCLLQNIDGNSYLQTFDDIITIPPSTVGLQINTETVTNIKVLFLMCDQMITVQLQPQGSVIGDVQPITLAGNNLPSILYVNELVGIYVSNPTINPARLTICGAGI